MVVHDAEAVVLGGGLAGLTAAYELLQHGVKPLVIEQSDRVGKYLKPLTVPLPDGTEITVDAGAESFATRNPLVADYIARLGLDVVQPSTQGAWCFPTSSTPFRLPKTSVLGVPFDWSDPELVTALGLEGVERARADEWLRTDVGDRSNLAAFVASRMGTEVVEKLLRPIAGGVHSSNPEKLDVTALHPNFWEIFERTGSLSAAVREIRAASPAGSAVAGVRGGMNMLAQRLADHILAGGGRILVGHTAVSLEREPDGWLTQTRVDDGSVEAFCAPRTVIALPARSATKLLVNAGFLNARDQDVVPVGTDISLVTLVVTASSLTDHGTGALIAPRGEIAAKGTTHVNSKWPWVQAALPADTHIFRFSYGRHGEPSAESDEALIAHASADLERIYSPQNARVTSTLVQRWHDALVPVTPQVKGLSTRAREQVDKQTGLTLVGAWVSGTGISAIIPNSGKAILRILG